MAYTQANPRPLSDWLPYVLPHVPGAPDVAARQALLRAAIEFCENSRAWMFIPPGINTNSGDATYGIPLASAESDNVVIQELYYNGAALKAKSQDELVVLYQNWMTAQGDPLYYTQLDQDSFTLVPVPLETLTPGVVLRAAYKPSRAAQNLPDLLYRQYADVIAAGAIAILQLTPDKPYTNPQLAQVQREIFVQGIGDAKRDAAKGFTRAPTRVVAQVF